MIKSFDELNITQLRSIVRKYNLHTKIVKYTKMDKPKLIEALSLHIHINEKGKISIKENVAGNKALTDLLTEIHTKMERLHQRLQRRRPRAPAPAPAPPKPATKPNMDLSDSEIEELRKQLRKRKKRKDIESSSEYESSSDEEEPINKKVVKNPPRLMYEGAKPLSNTIPEVTRDINKYVDEILKDLPDDKTKKAYIISTNEKDLPNNKVARAFNGLIPYIKRIEIISQINAFNNIYKNNGDYMGITVYKDGDILKITAGALIEMMEERINKKVVERLHISLLQGVGGAGLILDLIKNMAEDKVKHPWLKKIKYDFMDLQAIPSGNTLDFYDHKGGLVTDKEIKLFRDETKKAVSYLTSDAINEYKIIKKMPHKTEEQIKEKNKLVYKFWDRHMRNYHGLIPYFFFYDTPVSKRDKKDLSKDWHKTRPKETLKEEFDKVHKK